MKNRRVYVLAILIALFFAVSCEKSDETAATSNSLALPLYESMAIDFSDFTDNSNSGKSTAMVYNDKAPNGNWFFSKIVVDVWNSALFTTLAVPVASFKSAFAYSPRDLGDNRWQWTYTVDGFASQYSARLTAEVTGEEVLWKMYITKIGIGAFEEFLWFTGSSAMDGNSGFWLLNESAENPEAMLRIDWKRTNDEIGTIRYTWVRELDEQQNADMFKDSYFEYGLQDGDFDAYFKAYVYESSRQGFSDIRIEWNREAFFGRVKSLDYFEDEEWHCWDGNGEDTPCQ